MTRPRVPAPRRLPLSIVLVAAMVGCASPVTPTATVPAPSPVVRASSSPLATGSVPAASPGASPAATGASAVAAAGAPVARGYAMMDDLPGKPGVVLLGGATQPGAPDLADMWTFAPGSGWRETTQAALPVLADFAPLTGNAFAFDTGSKVAVFVDIKGHPWTFDPTTSAWSERPSGAGPTALLGAAMAYDSQSDRMIVFGGFDLATGQVNDETWSYDADASRWERMHPARGPSPRNYVAMAYDAASDRVVLFGGAPGSGVYGDTWAYDVDHDEWTDMAPASSPPARTYGAMVYDQGRDRMLLYGGSEDQETASLGDLWAYDLESNRWTEATTAGGPGVRAWHAMAYDAERGLVVVFGGGWTREAYTAETWLYDPASRVWTRSG